MSRRYELTDQQWDQIESLLPGRPGDPGGRGQDNRLFVNAVIWVTRTGAPWRDLPERFGRWNSVFQRFNRWAKAGVWEKVFRTLQDPDLAALLLDSTVIRAHQHSAGASPKKDRTRKPSDARAADSARNCISP
jgi:putative transposase